MQHIRASLRILKRPPQESLWNLNVGIVAIQSLEDDLELLRDSEILEDSF